MAKKFRADYDVKSALVLPLSDEPYLLRGTDPDFEVTFRNQAPDSAGHPPGLTARVVAEAESMEVAADAFRRLLAQQLDILSFATHSNFMIDKCRQIIEWEPYQRTRRVRPLAQFDPLYPPEPELGRDLLNTLQTISAAKVHEYASRSLRFFRLGVLERQPEDQFQNFWLAIETIAEGEKDTARAPIPCAASGCHGTLICQQCSDVPTRRPMARQAIRTMIETHCKDGAAVYRRLVKARDHLTHGRTPQSIETKVGKSLEDLVNEAAEISWHAIMSSFPKFEERLHFAHRDGDFVNRTLVVSPDMLQSFDAAIEYPSDDKFHQVNISIDYIAKSTSA